ncbi:MAG: hypothetical protein PHE61_05555 [Candidatus Omnitrophica bacterium]|nr:hypothetical protein [Candidatus Omnitrophota bacterium]
MVKKYGTLIMAFLVFSCAMFMIPAHRAYAATDVKAKPIAQVYEVQGDVVVQRLSEGNKTKVEQGVLLGSDDLLIFENGAAVGLYFKDGGKKNLKAQEGLLTCKVGDLVPKREAYQNTAVAFGTTRSVTHANAAVGALTLFYPQENLILASEPAIELAILDGSDGDLKIGKVAVQVSEGKKVISSKTLDDLKLGVPYAYTCEKLDSGKEYNAEIKLGIAGISGEAMTFSFNFFIAPKPDSASVSACVPFSDTVYRSLESTSVNYKGRAYSFWFIKSLRLKSDTAQPVISADIIIK